MMPETFTSHMAVRQHQALCFQPTSTRLMQKREIRSKTRTDKGEREGGRERYLHVTSCFSPSKWMVTIATFSDVILWICGRFDPGKLTLKSLACCVLDNKDAHEQKTWFLCCLPACKSPYVNISAYKGSFRALSLVMNTRLTTCSMKARGHVMKPADVRVFLVKRRR